MTRLSEIAGLVDGTLDGGASPDAEITGINTLAAAGPREVSFLANPRYRAQLAGTRAAAVLVDEKERAPEGVPLIRVKDPYLAFALVQRHFHPRPRSTGVRHPSAIVEPGATVARDVQLDAHAVVARGASVGEGSIVGANAVIGPGAVIGRECVIGAGAYVGERCVLGDRVVLQPGAVIGSDGFGYAWDGSRFLAIPQTGRVILEDDVEVGANTCIDRGALGDTVIERGAKLDNLIQIGHNVRIGAHTVMASQAGVSGSTVIGRGCQVGGQAGFAGHIHVGDGCRIAAQSGVIGDLEAGGTYAGTPAMPHRLWLKVSALVMRLPELFRTMKTVQRGEE